MMLYRPSYVSYFPIQQDNYLWELQYIFNAAWAAIETSRLDDSKFVTERIELNTLHTHQPQLWLDQLLSVNEACTEQIIASLESDPEFIIFKVGNYYVNREGNHRLWILRHRGVTHVTARTYRWEL